MIKSDLELMSPAELIKENDRLDKELKEKPLKRPGTRLRRIDPGGYQQALKDYNDAITTRTKKLTRAAKARALIKLREANVEIQSAIKQRPNTVGQTFAVTVLARQNTVAAMDTLLSIMNNLEEGASARVRAAEIILDRGWGKAPVTIDIVNRLAMDPRQLEAAARAILERRALEQSNIVEASFPRANNVNGVGHPPLEGEEGGSVEEGGMES